MTDGFKVHPCDLTRPGHFIGAPECKFWLHDHVGPYERWCVSTVGEYRPVVPGIERFDGRIHEIGYMRFYETMVFDRMEGCTVCSGEKSELEGGPKTNRWMELDVDGYKLREEAEDGHKAMVEKWRKRDVHERDHSIDD